MRQHSVVVADLAVDMDLRLEVGGVGDGHLDEDDVAVAGQVVVGADLAVLLAVLGRVRGARLVGDEADLASGAVPDEQLAPWGPGSAG